MRHGRTKKNDISTPLSRKPSHPPTFLKKQLLCHQKSILRELFAALKVPNSRHIHKLLSHPGRGDETNSLSTRPPGGELPPSPPFAALPKSSNPQTINLRLYPFFCLRGILPGGCGLGLTQISGAARSLVSLGEEVLLQHDAELLTEGLELLKVLVVLLLVLDLGLDTLEDTDGSGVVVHTAGGLKSSDDDGGRGDEIVGEGVVQVTLY